MFKNSHTGLSISDEAINFVKLKKTRKGFALESYGEKRLPIGVIKGGVIKDPERLADILHLLREKERLYAAHVAIPTEEDGLFEDYSKILQYTGISVKNLEPEANAIFRSVILSVNMGAYLIVNVGKYRTGLIIVAGGIVASADVLDIGGETVIQVTAEGVREDRGLNRNTITEAISSATVSGASILKEEISKRLLNWHMQKGREDKVRPAIEKIILCGSDASLAGLTEYLAVSLKTKTELANVWINILNPAEHIPEMTFNESLSYAPALGAALRGFE